MKKEVIDLLTSQDWYKELVLESRYSEKQILNCEYPYDLVSEFLLWTQTKKGPEYWSQVEIEWRKSLDKISY